MDRSTKFWNKISEKYAKRPVADAASYQKKLGVTQQYFRSDMVVLEFGCGTGSTAIVHAPHVKHIRAIDLSSKMLEIAKSKAEAAGVDNITFERAAIEELDVPDSSFDAVLGLSILHLLEDKEAVIAQVCRMLKPGGIFVTSTVCLPETMKYFKIIAPIGRLFGLMPLVKVFSAQDLKDSISSGGFDIDHAWQPEADNAVLFIVAQKPAPPGH